MAVDTSIFGQLKRLFSTDVIIRNVGGNKLKVVDTERIQSYGNVKTNSLVDRYNRIHMGSNRNAYTPTMNYQTLRNQLYTDYEGMDQDPILASALDIIADECTLKNEQGEILAINSPNENIQQVLYNLFYDVLNIEFNLWSWIRTMCKYGDAYLYMEIAEKFGIINVLPVSSYDVIRQEGQDPERPSYVSFKVGEDGSRYALGYAGGINRDIENYEMAHFRLLSDYNYLPYGRSYMEPARKVFKQLSLMEDAMLVHRVMRAPEKRIYYVDVGSIPPNEVDAYMEKIKNNIKKTPYIDPETGDYNLKYNMQSVNEDFYIPRRGNNDGGTQIDTLKGLEYNAIEDVEYLRDKMLSSLKIPKAFFGYEKDLEGKATLAAEDIRFARTIERIQRIVTSELHKIALVHLYTQGFDDEQLVDFELTLHSPSIIYEQEKVALLKEKTALAIDMVDSNLFPSDWVYDNVFNLSEDKLNSLRQLVVEDKKRSFRLNQLENEGNDPAASGTSYGTPHDLAALYGRGRMAKGDVPSGYDEKETAGRPKERASSYDTQNSNLGKDVMGSDALGDKIPHSIKTSYKGKTPLSISEGKHIYHRDVDIYNNDTDESEDFEEEDIYDDGDIDENYESALLNESMIIKE